MEPVHADHKTINHPTKRSSKNLLLVVVIFSLTIVICGIFWLGRDSKSGNIESPASADTSSVIIKQKLGNTSFPIFLPKSLPSGYSLKTDSVENNGTFANFVVEKNNGQQLIIAQQPRPTLVEEVTHVKDIQSDLGKAFIADVNGRYAGFLYGEKTLVIVTVGGQSSGTVNADITNDIASLISSLK